MPDTDNLADCKSAGYHTIENSIQGLLGGIRSTTTYPGAKKLKWLSKCTGFVENGEQLNSFLAGNYTAAIYR